VARHRTPEFIRDNAMADPRMKYFPLLEEERFQSMVAVPILSRGGDSIGVIVLHTKAPREFTEDTLRLLVHIASLVSGAIENAQLYDEQRRRVHALTSLSALAQEVAGATETGEVSSMVARGVHGLLEAEVCQVYRLTAGEGLQLLASCPQDAPAAEAQSATGVLVAALDGTSGRPSACDVWPTLDVADLLVTPLTAGGERVGLLCVGARTRVLFTTEDAEIGRAIAHLAAIAIKRAELIASLTDANIVKDLFGALEAGADEFAAAKAAEVQCELSDPYLIAYAEPAGNRPQASSEWRLAAEMVGRELAQLAPRAAIDVGPGPVRVLLMLNGQRSCSTADVLQVCRELGRRAAAAIGVSETHDAPHAATRACREAHDAVTVGRALLPDGGAIAYSEVGAYRYLVHIAAEDAPHDRMRSAVDVLAAYDRKRRTSLLDTLERYLAQRRGALETARALFIHPNTLRQRLARIEELTGLDLEREDLLSLELAIKLARLHGRSGTTP
jgi:GAF domain-containing protein